MSIDDFAEEGTRELSEEAKQILEDDERTPYVEITLQIAQSYDLAKGPAYQETIRQLGLYYAQKADLDGDKIFNDIPLAVPIDDEVSEGLYEMSFDEKISLLGQFLKGHTLELQEDDIPDDDYLPGINRCDLN